MRGKYQEEGRHKKPETHHKKGSDLDRVLQSIQRLEDRLIEIRDRCTGSQGRSLNGFVSAVYGKRGSTMATVPVPKLLDTEKILLSVMPRKADGHVDTNATIAWASSDPTQVGIEVGTESFVFTDPQFSEDVTCPGAFNCYALTPNSSGTATVTASAAGYESADFGPIVYEPGAPRSLNGSVGSPVSDI